jgi:hypothetical protein
MKNKTFLIMCQVVGLLLAMTPIAFAKIGRGNPKGEIISIEDPILGTIVILTEDEEDLTIFMPDDYDYSHLEEGMYVVAKGTWLNNRFEAIWVKEGEQEEGTEPGEAKGWGPRGIYCSGRKDKQHPMAIKIAELYDVTPELVMTEFCAGHGFGTIMLGLQTEVVTGVDVENLFSTRNKGKGWGQIWKAVGLVKNDKASNPPPGWLKKLDH